MPLAGNNRNRVFGSTGGVAIPPYYFTGTTNLQILKENIRDEMCNNDCCNTYTQEEIIPGRITLNKRLEELSTNQINDLIEKNLFAWIPTLGKLGRAHEDNPLGVKRSITKRRISLFNSIMDAKLNDNEVDSAIQVVIADGQSNNVPLLWWIGPSTLPADLDKRLIANGFKLDEDSPGMALDIERMNEKPAPMHFEITVANEVNGWRQWSATMAAGFEAPPDATYVVDEWADLLSVSDPQTVIPYVGWLNGKPVGVSLLLLAAGVAGIYSVATIPEARGKGVGSYMTQFPLIKAREKGYHIGVLEASEMGYPIYKSLGFKDYCRISSLRLKPQKL